MGSLPPQIDGQGRATGPCRRGRRRIRDQRLATDHEPRKPARISRLLDRPRKWIDLDEVDFYYLRKFMETYGQNLVRRVQVEVRAGDDPCVAAKHYTGSVGDVDGRGDWGRIVEPC